MASATATRYGLSGGLLGLEYDRINISDSDSDSYPTGIVQFNQYIGRYVSNQYIGNVKLIGYLLNQCDWLET